MCGDMHLIPSTGGTALRSVRDWVGACRKLRQRDALTILVCGHLLKAMFGDNFRRKGAEIKFMVFEQGSRATFNQHYHALMAIEGDHNWSDEQIAKAINEIDRNRSKRHWEKDVHVDFGWIKDSRFHSYLARYAAYEPDSVSVK
jgi:hypothetical protein